MIESPRLTCAWNLGKVKTFRLSSSALLKRNSATGGFPRFSGWGTNFQNWNKELRKFVLADPGKVLIQRDQGGAEAKVVAYLCRNTPSQLSRYRQLFENKIKPHSYLAAFIFKTQWEKELGFKIDDALSCKIPDLKANPTWQKLEPVIKDSDNWSGGRRYYFLGKKTCHAGNYREGGKQMSDSILEETGAQVVISPMEGQKFIDFYRKTLFPEITAWQWETELTIKQTKKLCNLFGFPRFFLPPFTDELIRDGISWVPQSTVGSITNNAAIKFQEYVEDNKLDWDLLNNSHDSLLVQAPEAEAEACASKLGEFMDQDLTTPRGEKFKMFSSVAIGYNWMPWYEKKNPNGLKER